MGDFISATDAGVAPANDEPLACPISSLTSSHLGKSSSLNRSNKLRSEMTSSLKALFMSVIEFEHNL